MPSILRSRIALFVMLGAFLIPVATSSLRGLTHILTCRENAETPFSVVIPERGDPLVTTSTRLRRGEEKGLCGGLAIDLGARLAAEGKLALVVPITNNTEEHWLGTVQLRLDSLSIPVNIGGIAPGETERDVVTIRLDPGTHEVTGSLLIGP